MENELELDKIEDPPLSLNDIRAVKSMFSAVGLPMELIYDIFERAQYVFEMKCSGSRYDPLTFCVPALLRRELVSLCLQTKPLGYERTLIEEQYVKISKVVFNVEYQDINSSLGRKYHNDCSWLDVSVFRPKTRNKMTLSPMEAFHNAAPLGHRHEIPINEKSVEVWCDRDGVDTLQSWFSDRDGKMTAGEFFLV